MSILMFNLYAYFKRGSNKQDYKGYGTPNGIKSYIHNLLNESGIATIIIENPENKHRFKWESSNPKWIEMGKPHTKEMLEQIDKIRKEFEASIGKAPHVFKTPITGTKLVFRVNGKEISYGKGVNFTTNHSNEVKIK